MAKVTRKSGVETHVEAPMPRREFEGEMDMPANRPISNDLSERKARIEQLGPAFKKFFDGTDKDGD